MKNTQLKHQHHQTSSKRIPVSVLAHDVSDPLNIGSLFRLADTFAVERIYLSGTSPTPPHPKIRKTARHTDTIVPFNYIDDALTLVQQLKQKNYQMISLELTTQSIDIASLQLASNLPVCLIIGAENTGVNQALLDLSDKTVHIPMRGQNSSMNVSTATAVALYEMTKQFS